MATSLASSRLSYNGSIRVPFELQGTLMRVTARINDRVSAPFIVDTGASHLSIPYALAIRLGIRITPDTPRRRIMTANGFVSEPIVMLQSVELGRGRVENLEAMVSTSMSIGLLGGNYFNNFVYQVDSAAREIMLSPNDRVVSGMTEDQWRDRFAQIRAPLDRLEAVRDQGKRLDEDRVRELEQRRQELRAKLEELDVLATRSQVPQNWRQPGAQP
jgi:clan AA aspartic protease (TIGR02281 family)